jgi:hypothetical protein
MEHTSLTIGLRPQMNKTKFITVRLPDDVMAKLKAEAEKNTRSISAQVLHYIRIELGKVKK